MERCRGYTLQELLFTFAIAAGLVGWGVPNFRDARLNAARTAQVNQLVHSIHLARSEAIKRNGVISICPTVNGDDCAGAGYPWQSGWIVFVNDDHDSPARRDAGEQLLRTFSGWNNGQIDANRTTLAFRPFGQMGVTASFTFCDERGSRAARAVIISQTGRPRVADRSAANKPLVCI